MAVSIIVVKYGLYTPIFYNVNNKTNIMKSFTHLIITRFMCNNFIKEDSNENIFSPEWKEMSFNMASRHIIPTLENQTNQNFVLVFLVSRYATATDIAKIRSLSNKLKIEVFYLDVFTEAIKNLSTDYLITSRLDYDDHVYNKCVEDIQNFIKSEPEFDAQLWGLDNGVSIIDGETDSYLMYEFPYIKKDEGLAAPMATLILKKTAVPFYFDVYKLGYHTELILNILGVQRHYFGKIIAETPAQIYTKHASRDIDYIWIRHKHSASAIVKNVYHTTNIKVNLSKQELKEKFGYIL